MSRISELSDDETVNPDSAVKVMEIVTTHLSSLPADDRAGLAALVLTRLNGDRTPEWREFIEMTPIALNLVDDD
jgi:hypothetical protein